MAYSSRDGYNRKDASFHLIREKFGLRNPDGVFDDPPARVLAADVPEEGEFEVMRPTLTKEWRSVLSAGGVRAKNFISDLGFEVVDQALNFHLQTAKLLYAALGGCVTTGTSFTPALTGTITAGQGTATLTVTATGPNDSLVDHYLLVTSGLRDGLPIEDRYCIIANDATTVTIDINSAGDINGETYEILGPPFTHAIAEGSDLSSFAAHIQLPTVDDTESIYVALLGLLVKGLEITFEPDGDAIQAASMVCPQAVDTTEIAGLPANISSCILKKWGHLGTVTLTYDGDDVITKELVERAVLNFESESGVDPRMGDFAANFKKVGDATYEVTLEYTPVNRVLYDLINTRRCDYASPLALTFNIVIDAEDYINITYSKLILREHPTTIPAPADVLMSVPAVFQTDQAISPVIEAVDGLGLEHYEGSQIEPEYVFIP